MYYEPYKRKKRHPPRRRSGPGRFLARLIFTALMLAVIAAAVLWALPVSLLQVEPEGMALSPTDGLPTSRLNVLLVGTDLMSASLQRSDTLIIATLGGDALRLTSVLRDTVVDIPGHGSGKINAAYAYGGPELVMRTLNENFGLNILYYIRADFVSLVKVVDAIGGVDLGISEAELKQINETCDYMLNAYPYVRYDSTPLSRAGENVHLNGLQALSYARIRKIDSDFRRAGRQRALLEAMLKRIRANLWNPVLLVRLGREVTGALETNLSVPALISLGEKALLSGGVQQLRLPADGTYTDDGSALRITDRERNITAFRGFAYQ